MDIKLLKIFVPFEISGKVRQAFRNRGHDAWSCDLLEPDDNSNFHLQGDYRKFIRYRKWDIMIAFPVCTTTCVSGNRTYAGTKARERGVQDFIEVYNQPIKRKCLEHPISVIPKKFKTWTQVIHPWQFGYKETKQTCLYLVNLEDLIPTDIVGPPPKDKILRKEWERVWRMAPSITRSKDRAETNQGIADAMAAQWS